ncbi:hypothetical protein [Lentilactobacillus sp. Marseille-Q4993]|uniref:hypothetical protein n=1 Tax=Lentilactobacillus sp. Marseille-Q4993 TaxID=3039492 RepID=UPI0024BCA10C|nr:hypothetical protein [Lentilactobacillus sp. Marseille-Q4993]
MTLHKALLHTGLALAALGTIGVASSAKASAKATTLNYMPKQLRGNWIHRQDSKYAYGFSLSKHKFRYVDFSKKNKLIGIDQDGIGKNMFVKKLNNKGLYEIGVKEGTFYGWEVKVVKHHGRKAIAAESIMIGHPTKHFKVSGYYYKH